MNKAAVLLCMVHVMCRVASQTVSDRPSPSQITGENHAVTCPTDPTAETRVTESQQAKTLTDVSRNAPEESADHSQVGNVERDDRVLGTSVSTTSEENHFRINVSVCSNIDDFVINSLRGEIYVVKDSQVPVGTDCTWTVTVPVSHSISIYAYWPQGPSGRTDDLVTLSDFTGTEISKFVQLESRKTMKFHSTVYFQYRSIGQPVETYLTFSFSVAKNLAHTLNVVQLSNTTSFVTSPNYDGEKLLYPNDVNTSHLIHVPENHLVVAVFSHFELGSGSCGNDILTISSLDHVTKQKLCGRKHGLLLQTFKTSIALAFITDHQYQYTGFKMLYSVLPQSDEPKQLTSGLYNCSVPHYYTFRELFSCNLQLECEAGEDEEECPYNNTDCGRGAVSAGNKCYRIIRPNFTLSWDNAYYSCQAKGQNLVTMATPEEWNRFKEIMGFGENLYKVPIFVGLRLRDSIPASVKTLYTDVWQWVDDRAAFFKDLTNSNNSSIHKCAYYYMSEHNQLFAYRCDDESMGAVYICEFDKPNSNAPKQPVQFPTLRNDVNGSQSATAVFYSCSSGEQTHDFMSCDPEGPCDVEDYVTLCRANDIEVPMFECERTFRAIPYTLVCDHVNQCPDYSDESFCQFRLTCPANTFRCHNGQCIAKDGECDGLHHCTDESDELCGPVNTRRFPPLTLPPATVYMTGRGHYDLLPMNESDLCPVTHFRCPGGYCLPVYLRCNDFADCPGREDEDNCTSYTCPGFYRCRGSNVCLHPSSVCDEVFQCPQHDDEWLCDESCPSGCHCQGLSFVCKAKFDASSFDYLRYLDASRSGMTLGDVSGNFYLIRLRLSHCNILSVPDTTLPNLRHLDLSYNSLTNISMLFFKALTNLQVLDLSHNPLVTLTGAYSHKNVILVLKRLDLSHTRLTFYDSDVLSCCADLKILNISSSYLKKITEKGFHSTPKLERLDLSNTQLSEFPKDMLRKLEFLKIINADSFKLCCEAVLPEDFDNGHCHAKQDELSSCDDLVESDMYRALLWLFASLALCGNVGSFVTRLYLSKERSAGKQRSSGLASYGIFVTNLSVADFFMGIYLAMIGVTDKIYRGIYLWHDDEWKRSAACKIAGFMSLMSSEVSAFIICLITLDRFLVLHFPFSRFHFHLKSAQVACGIVWIAGFVLAVVPLLPMTTHWDFYGQSGTCIPLPFNGNSHFLGHDYSFGIMIILNFALFLTIAVGQIFIYRAVRANSICNQKTGSRDATIARRLTTIVVSDFLCWFPIGLLGILARTGTPVPRWVQVGVAIIILPFNSALNPFLYTFNVVMEKRRKAQVARLLKQLEMRHFEKNKTVHEGKSSGRVSKEFAMGQLEIWLKDKVLTHEDVVSCLLPLVQCENNDSNNGTLSPARSYSCTFRSTRHDVAAWRRATEVSASVINRPEDKAFQHNSCTLHV